MKPPNVREVAPNEGHQAVSYAAAYASSRYASDPKESWGSAATEPRNANDMG
jgi:hypothetical protein